LTGFPEEELQEIFWNQTSKRIRYPKCNKPRNSWLRIQGLPQYPKSGLQDIPYSTLELRKETSTRSWIWCALRSRVLKCQRLYGQKL